MGLNKGVKITERYENMTHYPVTICVLSTIYHPIYLYKVEKRKHAQSRCVCIGAVWISIMQTKG